jgi:hypothetical protein
MGNCESTEYPTRRQSVFSTGVHYVGTVIVYSYCCWVNRPVGRALLFRHHVHCAAIELLSRELTAFASYWGRRGGERRGEERRGEERMIPVSNIGSAPFYPA